MKQLLCLFLLLFSLSSPVVAQSEEITFPKIELGELSPDHRGFSKPIDTSKEGELTIASFNVRNFGVMNRGLNDFTSIVGLTDEADVVVFQEVGLGVYRSDTVTRAEQRQINLVAQLLQLTFGEEWGMLMPPSPTPDSIPNGRETAILMYRKTCKGFSLTADWANYVNLGEKRDMPVFKLSCQKNGSDRKEEIWLGSVHFTPYDPDRGYQMIRATNWLRANSNKKAIVAGDFNWGYRRTPRIKNYSGEALVSRMHERGSVFQLFYHLSYLKNGKPDQLRSNLKFRAAGKFYDQFLTTPIVASMLADGGKLLEDCGVLAFDEMTAIEREVVRKKMDKYDKAVKKFLKINKRKADIFDEELYQKAMEKFESDIRNNATFVISDHRPIWMQLRVF